MEIDRHKTPIPGCIDGAWCALDCEECWRQYDERMKGVAEGTKTSTELQRG